MGLSNIVAGCMHWGSWGKNFDTNEYANIITSCLELGITSFDHADIYGHYTTEAEFGAAVKQLNNRKQIQLITKCGIKLVTPNRSEHTIKSYDTSAAHIIKSVENSLQNFHTDYIDVLLLHRPDILLHPEEVAEAFTILKKAGKVLEFGVSNFTVTQMELVHKYFPIQYNQIEISPLVIDAFTNGLLDYCMLHNITPMAWSPMKGGTIYDDKKIEATIAALAKKYNCTNDSIVYAWLLKHPSKILPITGSSSIERIKFATEAISITLTNEDWYVLYSAALGKDVA